MPPKKVPEPERKPIIGRVGTNLRVGIVGVPNVGKSTFFNVLTKSSAAAENFPFCTIDPNEITRRAINNLIPLSVKMTSNDASSKTRYYIPENNEEACLKLDQTVLYTKECIKQVFGITVKEEQPEDTDPFADEWYPLANSYYTHTEDVDSLGKVNYLLTEDLPPDFVKSKRKTPEQDPRSEKLAQQKYLASNPLCFIILGKPGIGEEDLGRKLAELWHCEFIEPQTLVEEEIEAGTKIGIAIEFNLRLGRSVEIDVILKLVEKRVKSETCKHRGFILCGLPLIANDLYIEDTVSSPSTIFNAKEVLEEIVDLAVDVSNMIDPTTLKADSRESVDRNSVGVNFLFKKLEVPKDLGSEEHFNESLDIGQDYEAQLRFLFDLVDDPFIIIYIKCDTKDVLHKRDSYRFNIELKEFYDMQLVNFYRKMLYYYLRTEDCIVDDIFDSEYLLLDVSHLRNLVTLPFNFKGHVATQIDRYNKVARQFIEKQMLMHDPQYIIKVDGRITTARNYRIVRARTKTLPLQKVVTPKRAIIPDSFIMPGRDCDWDYNFYGEADGSVERTPTLQDYFRHLSTVDIVHIRFPWTLSDWGVRCPVSLYEGKVTDGDMQYVVRFMNRLFFLANEDAFVKFYRNPRPYLLSPYPKSPCKIFIFGPKNSGKTALARCLGYYFDCKVYTAEEILTTYLHQKEIEVKQKVREIARREAMKILDQRRAAEAEEREHQRQAAIKDWYNTVSVLIKQFIEYLEIEESKFASDQVSLSEQSMTSSKMRFVQHKSEYKSSPDMVVINEMLAAYNITEESLDPAVWQGYLEQKEKLLVFLPEDMRYKIQPCPAMLFDDFVVDYVNEAVSKTTIDTTKFTLEEAFHKYLNKIQDSTSVSISDSCLYDVSDRWIIDGMVCDPNLIESLYPTNIGSEIIVLDDCVKAEFLIKRCEQQEYGFPDYRSFFTSIGKCEVAERSPSATSTASYKESLVRNILYDILDSDSFYDDNEEVRQMERKIRACKEDILKFREGWQSVKEMYLNYSCQLIEINIADKSYPDLFAEAIRRIDDNYRTSASLLTEKERDVELKAYSDSKGLLDDNARVYGDTSHYCPLAYHEHSVLWRGKEKNAIKFENRIYLIASDEDVKRFLNEPRKFLSLDSEKDYPPPRVCVTGYLKSGKTTIARLIADNLGLHYVSYESLVQKWYELTPEQTFDTLKLAQNYEQEEEELVSYLYSGKPLPSEKLENMADYWHGDPYRSSGVVLDDFPKRETDIKFMIKHKLLPDIIIQLAAPLGSLRSKILEEVVSSWRDRLDRRKAWEEKNKDRILEREQQRKQRFDELMEESRERRYLLKRQEQPRTTEPEHTIAGSVSQVSFDSVAEQEDTDEINRLLDEELPAITFGEVLGESLDVIMEKLERNLMESLEFEGEFLNKIKEVCEKELIPYSEIPLNVSDMEKTRITLFLLLDEFKFRTGLFERCYDVISLDVAYKLLTCGYYFLSKFGKTCPVMHYKYKNPAQLYLPMILKQNMFPVIHRSYIYFIIGLENRELFKTNPLKYVDVDFDFPTFSLTVGIIGPPKCGKTTLAKRLKHEFGLKVVTRGQAARYVLNYLPYSELSKNLEEILRKGEEIPTDMLMSCVESTVYDPRVVSEGIIFDGFPNTTEEVKCLAYLGLIPNVVVDLTASKEEVFTCAENDSANYVVPKYSKLFIEHLFFEWSKTAEKFRRWFDAEYQITATVPINTCNWSVFHQSKLILKSVIFEVKHYIMHAFDDWPLRLANMRVTPLEFVERRSSYKNFCPVCLHFSNYLVCGGSPPDRTGLIQYRQYYYWVCHDHEELFLKAPEQYLVPYNNHAIPSDMPKFVTLTEMPLDEKLFARGFCVVCYKNFVSEIKGRIEFALMYLEKIYLFDKKECFDAFFKTPHHYIHQDFVVPNVDYPSLNYKDLPILGMLEQYVAKYVLKGLSFVVKKRPIIPGLGIAESAAVGIGIMLKINNELIRKDFLPYYREGYDLFCERTENLLTYLDRMKCMINPYLHYEEPLPDFKLPGSSESSDTESVGSSTMFSHVVD